MKAAARIAGALGLFAAGLAATAAAVTWLITPAVQPQRDTGMPREKLAELAPIASQIDVLVVGTSRLLHGFDPAVFAAETARRGNPLRAYNLSLQRLLLWEQTRMLDDALALPGLRPKLILLEPAVGLGIAPENIAHARTVEFETPAAWRLANATVLGSDRAPAHKAWNLASHGLVFALHALNYGLYTDVAFPARKPADEPDTQLVPERRGFLPKPDLAVDEPPAPWLGEMAREFAARYAHDAAEENSLPPAMRAHFENLRARLQQRGIAVIFVQPPQLGFTSEELRELTFAFPRSLGPRAVISFLDPAKYPALYDARWWVDYNHLRATGARLFTTALAHELMRANATVSAR